MSNPHANRSTLLYVIHSLGPVFGPVLLIVAIALVTVIILLALEVRMTTSVRASFIQEVKDAFSQRRYKDVFELARIEPSFAGRVLAYAMGRLQFGLEEARQAARQQLDAIHNSRHSLIMTLKMVAITTLMVGFGSSLVQIILFLRMLESPGPGAPSIDQLPFMVGRALVVLVCALGISLVAVFWYFWFDSRSRFISLKVHVVVDELLTQMHYESKKRPPDAGPEALGRTAPTKPPPFIFPASGSAEPGQ